MNKEQAKQLGKDARGFHSARSEDQGRLADLYRMMRDAAVLGVPGVAERAGQLILDEIGDDGRGRRPD